MDDKRLKFSLEKVDATGARAGRLTLGHGIVETPTFMPVATHAHVRHLTLEEVGASGAGVCLGNTYHLWLQPGLETFRRFEGIHRYMGWSRNVLTDSGGFQIFSLADACIVDEEGARFRSPVDSQTRLLTPEISMEAQAAIGSDVAMVLDVCHASTADEAQTRAAMERTHRWAERSLRAQRDLTKAQALFGIVQGGLFKNLREESARVLTALPFDGFAVGGLAVGEGREDLYSMTQFSALLLPDNKPRYLMGVGTPIDLLESVRAGIDMFDCILPTKMGQQGYGYTFDGRLRLTQARFRLDEGPLESSCDCFTCTHHPRAYVHHLLKGDHALGARLLSVHNLRFYQRLMARMREAIVAGRFGEEYRTLKSTLAPTTSPSVSLGVEVGDFEVVALTSGVRAIRHKGHGEVMHPGIGPEAEARNVYIQPSRLEDRLRVASTQPVRVLDFGLGGGANAVAALEVARALGPGRRRPLEVWSLENDTRAFELALRHADEGFPFLAPWKDAGQGVLRTGFWESNGISWWLLRGDAQKTFADLPPAFDVIFYDPFSPKTDAPLWSVDFLKRVAARLAPGGILSTYSIATPTRVSFLLAGFFVGSGVASGTRGETTVCTRELESLEHPLRERWLWRWRRSDARGPHGGEFNEACEDAVWAHPQFARLQEIRALAAQALAPKTG